MLKITALALVLVTACVDMPDQPDDVTNVPKLSANAMTPTNLQNSNLNTLMLTAANAASMGNTIDRRAALQYAVGCALAPNQSITFTASGWPQTTYYGAMSVATAWLSRDLTKSEAAWVSSCVISRINLTGTVVQISVRGATGGYATTSQELTDYQIEEGAFWGNVFINRGSLVGNACNGIQQSQNDTYGDLPLRECAEWNGVLGQQLTPCGFNYAGLCTSACTTMSPYGGCAFNGGTAAAEVATTFLYGLPQ